MSIVLDGTAGVTTPGLSSTSNATVTGTLGVTGNATFDTDALFVDAANNRVGIGTATPANILDIKDATNYGLNQSVANVTIWTTTAMGIDVGGSIGFGGKYNSTDSLSWADIHGKKENATNNNAAGYLAFLTRDNSVGNVERMRISSIGAVTMGGTLEVTGSATLGSIAGTAVATQANQETATSTTTAVSPGRQQFHPSAAKAWVRYQTVTTTTNIASYNVASLTDNGTGDTTITFTTNFSSGTSYNGVFSGRQDGNNINCVISAPANFASSTIRVTTFNIEAIAQARDYEIVSGVMFGDQ